LFLEKIQQGFRHKPCNFNIWLVHLVLSASSFSASRGMYMSRIPGR
jgi:hypothetical protein